MRKNQEFWALKHGMEWLSCDTVPVGSIIRVCVGSRFFLFFFLFFSNNLSFRIALDLTKSCRNSRGFPATPLIVLEATSKEERSIQDWKSENHLSEKKGKSNSAVHQAGRTDPVKPIKKIKRRHGSSPGPITAVMCFVTGRSFSDCLLWMMPLDLLLYTSVPVDGFLWCLSGKESVC